MHLKQAKLGIIQEFYTPVLRILVLTLSTVHLTSERIFLKKFKDLTFQESQKKKRLERSTR